MITISGLTKTLEHRTALAGVDLSIDPGESVAVSGPDREGRATLMQLLATLIRPTSGTIVIGGLDAVTEIYRVRRLLAYAGPTRILPNRLRVDEYLRLSPARAISRPQGPASRRISWPDRHAPIEALANDVRRRLTLAAAIAAGAAFCCSTRRSTGSMPQPGPRVRMARRSSSERHHCDRLGQRARGRAVRSKHRALRRLHRRVLCERGGGSGGPPSRTGRSLMRAVVLREALVAARRPALVSAAIVSATLLALFPVAWGVRGIPTFGGISLYDQQFRLEWILALVLLPWTAAGDLNADGFADLVGLSALTAVQPSRLLLARLLAATIALVAVIAGALPVVISAQQMSAVVASRLIADQLALLTFALPAAIITVWWMQLTTDRLLGWLGAAATTIVVVTLARLSVATMNQAAIALATISMGAAAILLAKADVWWRYLSERRA